MKDSISLILIVAVVGFISFAQFAFYAWWVEKKRKSELSIKSGIIVEKKFEPPHSRIEYGSKNPFIIEYKDSWIIRVKGIDKTGKERIRSVKVPKETYDKLNVGELWKEEMFHVKQFNEKRGEP